MDCEPLRTRHILIKIRPVGIEKFTEMRNNFLRLTELINTISNLAAHKRGGGSRFLNIARTIELWPTTRGNTDLKYNFMLICLIHDD